MRLIQSVFFLLLGASQVLTGEALGQSRDNLYIPLFTYRTGPFAASGIPIANGLRDYLTMLNERDGGVGGVKLNVEECETSYDTKKGVECYEAVKTKSPLVINPYSTGTTLELIPKAAVDKIPILSMGYGLSASAVGGEFPWIFNPPATYWDAMSIVFKYIGGREGGLDKLKGKTIGYIFLDGGFGREPIPMLEQFAKDYGFDVKMYPVTVQDMQNQSAHWLGVRRDRPAWMIMWSFGAMTPTAIKEAARVGFPRDHLIGPYYAGGEDDARPAGSDGKGYLSLNFNAVGRDYSAVNEIIRYVVDKGLSGAARERIGENLYNRGVYNSVLIAEAIRNAQRLTGKKVISASDMRRGLETLDITVARWKELGLEGFGAPLKVTCSDHNGHHIAYVQQWDGTRWVRASDWIEPMRDRVMPLLDAAAKAYVSKDPSWPKRTEACDDPH